MRRYGLAVIFLLPPLVAALAGFASANWVRVQGSMWLVTIFVAVILGLLELVARQDSVVERRGLGFLQVILGADGRISTSKTVVALWTMLFAMALVQLTGMTVFAGLPVAAAFGSDWNSYLLLLGGPFASAVLAKGITVAQLSNDPTAKSVTAAAGSTAISTATPTAATPSPADLVTDDGGTTSLPDTQYVVFSLVAIIFFVGAFVRNIVLYAYGAQPGIALPQIPPTLLGLTSLAALTYVGHKAVPNQGLRMVTMLPNPVGPGQELTITLANLPPAATIANTSVSFQPAAGGTATNQPPSSLVNGTLSVTAPGTSGVYQVSVATAQAVTSPQSLTVS